MEERFRARRGATLAGRRFHPLTAIASIYISTSLDKK